MTSRSLIDKRKRADIIYVARTESHPKNCIKIGITGRNKDPQRSRKEKTGNVEARMKGLSGTSIPIPFYCYFACTVIKDAELVEKKFHKAFEHFRVRLENKSSNRKFWGKKHIREFFCIDKSKVIGILQLLMVEDVTPVEYNNEVANMVFNPAF